MALLVDDQSERADARHRSTVDDGESQEVPATDSQLLKQFIHDRREDAFTELVDRHASMVLGVCRRILRDEHEAEDVFQATFLILANKARQIQRRHPASLAAWLHKVAYRTALRTAQSKHRKGKSLVDDVQSTEPDHWLSIAQQEEQLLLHEELSKLPESYREAVILCCLEGMGRREAAGQLASTPEAVQKRVARGKQMLRMRLVRRGVAAMSALAVAAVPAVCQASATPSLVSLTSKVCAATVLHADMTIYSTTVGHIAQQGEIAMRTLSTSVVMATTAVCVVGAPLLLLAGIAGGSGGSPPDLETPIAAFTEQELAADRAAFVAAPADDAEGADTDRQEKPPQDENLREILSRQKGDQLNVYLNSRGAYVNGKSISADQLPKLVRQAGLKQAVLTAEPYLARERVAGWEALIRQGGVDDITRAAPQLTRQQTQDEKLREILSRQQGDQLKVYLKGTHGMYVNGKSISAGQLSTLIRDSGLEQAVVSAALGVHPARVTDVAALIRKEGVASVESDAPQRTLEELAVATREKVVRDRETKLREILARQKEDQLQVYLNSRGAYINGKSVSADELTTIVRVSGLDQAILTAELQVAHDKVTEVAELLRKGGATNVELSIRQPD